MGRKRISLSSKVDAVPLVQGSSLCARSQEDGWKRAVEPLLEGCAEMQVTKGGRQGEGTSLSKSSVRCYKGQNHPCSGEEASGQPNKSGGCGFPRPKAEEVSWRPYSHKRLMLAGVKLSGPLCACWARPANYTLYKPSLLNGVDVRFLCCSDNSLTLGTTT